MYNIFFVTEHSLKGYLLWFNLDWVLVYSFIAVNATFNNISVISQQSVLLVKESGEHHRQTLSHNMWYRVHVDWARLKRTTLVVISTDGIGSCKSNYHMRSRTTTDPLCLISMFWYLQHFLCNIAWLEGIFILIRNNIHT